MNTMKKCSNNILLYMYVESLHPAGLSYIEDVVA